MATAVCTPLTCGLGGGGEWVREVQTCRRESGRFLLLNVFSGDQKEGCLVIPWNFITFGENPSWLAY